jgi:hypothetical protein
LFAWATSPSRDATHPPRSLGAMAKTFVFGGSPCEVERTFGVGFSQWVVCEVKERGKPHFGPALTSGRRSSSSPTVWDGASETIRRIGATSRMRSCTR